MTDRTPEGSAEQSVRRILETLTHTEQRLQAVAQRIDDIALADARRCDALAAAGSHAGPLHGVPFAIKDIIDLAGVPTRSGSLTRASQAPAADDATAVARLRAAGAVPIVKTHTVEFAFGGWGTNQTVGTPRNPWDAHTARVPGGSSSGTGVLVGAGIIPMGFGTDTGGSVRIPAAFCGCVGLKTSIGLVSRAGVTPLSETLDTVGPLATSVTLAAQMLDAIQGNDLKDPSTTGVHCASAVKLLDKGNDGLRIGVVPVESMPDLSPEMRASFEKALRLLQESGAQLTPFVLPMSLLDYQRRATVIVASEAYASYQAIVDDADSGLATPNRTRMLLGKTIAAHELIRVRRERLQAIADFEAIIDGFDSVVLPTTPDVAIPIAQVDEAGMSMSSHTRLANYLALAALAVPIDLTPAGLPTSLQIVVRRFDDPLALQIGRGFEKARGEMPQLSW